MDSILDIIQKRLSIRAYQDRQLPEATVKALLEAARHAPTARNLQELEYRVITRPALLQKLSDGIAAVLKREGAGIPPPRPGTPPPPARPHFFYRAPLLVLVIGPADNHFIYTDAALAAQNMMLYATAQNLGSCFIGMATFIEKDPALRAELHIGDQQKIAAAVIAGYPAETPVPKEKMLKVEYFS